MKPLLLLLSFFLMAFMAGAQNQPGDLEKPLGNWKFQRPLRIIVPKDSALLNTYPFSSKKPGVYRLKDGMPCIVPDTKGIAVIPNAWKGSMKIPFKSNPPAIPDPSAPNGQPDTK